MERSDRSNLSIRVVAMERSDRSNLSIRVVAMERSDRSNLSIRVIAKEQSDRSNLSIRVVAREQSDRSNLNDNLSVLRDCFAALAMTRNERSLRGVYPEQSVGSARTRVNFFALLAMRICITSLGQSE
jgi:hypothetical protein